MISGDKVSEEKPWAKTIRWREGARLFALFSEAPERLNTPKYLRQNPS
jgi:hypothetical protein